MCCGFLRRLDLCGSGNRTVAGHETKPSTDAGFWRFSEPLRDLGNGRSVHPVAA